LLLRLHLQIGTLVPDNRCLVRNVPRTVFFDRQSNCENAVPCPFGARPV